VSIAAWLDGALQRAELRWVRIWRAAGTFVLAGTGIAAWSASAYLAVQGHSGLAISVFGLSTALVAAFGLCFSLRRKEQGQLPVFAAGMALLTVFSVLSPSTFSAIDTRRGFHTLTAAITEVVVPGITLYGYGMGERELGVVGFERRAVTPQIVSPNALRDVLRDRQNVVLVSAEARTKLQAQGEWPETAEVVAEPRMRRRPFVLIRGTAAQTPQ
jgi:hypothetical protein